MEVAKRPVPDVNYIRICIEDLDSGLRCCTEGNGTLSFFFKEEKNILDPATDISASSSFMFGYEGDEEDNQHQTSGDMSFFCGKEHNRPSLEGFIPETHSEETNKFSPKLDTQGNDSAAGKTSPITDSCVCSNSKLFSADTISGKESSMDMLSAAFRAACTCSPACSNSVDISSVDGTKDTKKRPNSINKKKENLPKNVKPRILRSTNRRTDSSAKEVSENSDRERRKRPANWPMVHQGDRKGSLRPKVESLFSNKAPWR